MTRSEMYEQLVLNHTNHITCYCQTHPQHGAPQRLIIRTLQLKETGEEPPVHRLKTLNLAKGDSRKESQGEQLNGLASNKLSTVEQETLLL